MTSQTDFELSEVKFEAAELAADLRASLAREAKSRAEIERLRAALRVNGLRWGCTDAEIDAVLYPSANEQTLTREALAERLKGRKHPDGWREEAGAPHLRDC